jgi:hypothetical protein
MIYRADDVNFSQSRFRRAPHRHHENDRTTFARSWLAPHANDSYGTNRLPQRFGIHAQEEHADYGNRRHAAQEDVTS